MIYLDNAASTRLSREVHAAMTPFLEGAGGNPSSPHAAGRHARKAVEDAREVTAGCLGADPKEIVFTSGATESNDLAIRGVADALASKGRHLVTTAVEHPSVAECCARLEKRGFRVTRIPVDRHARVDPRDVAKAITPETILVSIMAVNNEVGTVQPMGAIREAAQGVLLHSDGAQAVGKVPIETLHADLLTFSAHKFHGPKGVGGLRVRTGTPLAPRHVGGGQEFERRAGTENVAGIVGLAEALRRAVGTFPSAALRDRLQAGLEKIGSVRVLGHPEHRAPHLLNVIFEQIDGEAAILALDAEGICVSAGSACASLSLEPSPVLRAMGFEPDLARGSMRFSLSTLTTAQEIDEAIEIVPRVIERLRKISPATK